MQFRLTRYLGFLPNDRRTAVRVFSLTVVGLGAYAIALLTFLAGNPKGAFESVFNPASTGGVYSITLKSIDHGKERISFDLDISLPEGRGTITKCLYFGHRLWRVGGYSEGLSAVLVNLKELPRDSLQPDQRPGPGYTTYRGAGDFYFETDLRMFPFDRLWWDVSVSEQCWTPSARIDSTTFRNLLVRNEIPDYSLSLSARAESTQETKDPSDASFVLHRSMFLQILTIIVFAAAFASSIALIWRAQEKAKDLSLLTYFAALWGIRAILLSPIQGLKAFPTLLEMTILFLFSFTLVGVILAPRLVPLAGEKRND